MTGPTAPRPTATPAPAAPAPRARPAKHRDFKPALARATLPAAPTPGPVAQPAIGRGGAPLPLPAAIRPSAPPAPAAPAALHLPALRPWEMQRNADFRHRIAEAERSAEHPEGGYHLRNPASGALGRYQFQPVALRDIGWMDAAGRWTEQAARHGAADEAAFLANPVAQEAAMSAYLARQEAILERLGLLEAAGGTVTGLDGEAIPLTTGALVAAAHRRGAATLARYLAHRRQTPDAPLTPAQRQAFASIEARLRGFAEVAYASERPGPRLIARRDGPAA